MSDDLYEDLPVDRFKDLGIRGEGSDTKWMAKANCIDANLEVFFAEGNAGANPYKDAEEYCSNCLVAAQCLKFIMEAESHARPQGYFGNTSANERAAMYRGDVAA